MKKIALIVMAVFLVFGCAKGSAIETGADAPYFTLTDIEGKSVNLIDFKGKAVILDFFASWCPPCKQEVPDFIALQKQYGEKGLAVVGVALVSREDARKFAADMGINYPVLIDDGKVSVAYGPVRSIPTTYVLDKDMKVKKVYIGFRPKSVFEVDIKEILR